MKDNDVDIHLRQQLSGNQPREAFKQQTLINSTAEFVRVHRRRSAWRRVELAAVAILISGLAFLGGRMSVSQTLPKSMDVPRVVIDKSSGVNVSSELVAWLEAARLFRQLGMEDRMARAVKRAASLLPVDTVAASSVTGQTFAATGEGIVEDKNKQVSLADILQSLESVESVNGIMAQSFGGYSHARNMD
jgi:hypothetical protein